LTSIRCGRGCLSAVTLSEPRPVGSSFSAGPERPRTRRSFRLHAEAVDKEQVQSLTERGYRTERCGEIACVSSLEASSHIDLIVHLKYPYQLHVAVRNGLLLAQGQRRGAPSCRAAQTIRPQCIRARSTRRRRPGRWRRSARRSLHDISCLAHTYRSCLVGSYSLTLPSVARPLVRSWAHRLGLRLISFASSITAYRGIPV
jgi:hypothetical protein